MNGIAHSAACQERLNDGLHTASTALPGLEIGHSGIQKIIHPQPILKAAASSAAGARPIRGGPAASRGASRARGVQRARKAIGRTVPSASGRAATARVTTGLIPRFGSNANNPASPMA